MFSVKDLTIENIQRDKKIQQRNKGIIPARVSEYAKSMGMGQQFPPIVVFHNDKEYWLADGFHRCEAAILISKKTISAEIRKGDYREALLFAAGANAEHGVRRTNEDKRKAVMTLLEDEEWRQWSDQEIARRTRCTQPFVSKLRKMVNTGPIRKGADGRLINTRNIGKRPKGIELAWKQASKKEKMEWIKKHQEEIRSFMD
jgi:hypothetical protein